MAWRRQLLAFLFLALAAIPAYGGDVTLAWDADPANVNVAGYKIYIRLISGNYALVADAGNYTLFTVTGLNEGVTYYFVATTYNKFGRESGFSNEISKTVEAISPDLPTVTTRGPSASVAGLLVGGTPPEFEAVGAPNLATPYFSPLSGGTSFQSTGTGDADFRVSHGRIEPDPGNPAPAGAAIIALRSGNGVLQSEATLPSAPPVQSGYVPAEVRGAVNTGIAISNQTTEEALISFSFTDEVGTAFGHGSFTLAQNQQIVAFLNEAPFNLATDLEGTFLFTSSVPVGAIALRGLWNERGEFLFTTVPVVSFGGGDPDQAAALIPLFLDGGDWTTEVVLTNPTSVPQSGTIEFFGPGSGTGAAPLLDMTVNGVSNQTFPYSISPHSSVRLITEGGPAATVQTGSVRIAPRFDSSQVPTALAVISRRKDGVTVSQGGVSAVRLGSAFRAHVVSSGTAGQIGSIQSGLAIANPSKDPTVVTFEITTFDGTSPALTTQSVIVPADGQISKLINQLFPEIPDDFAGMIRMTAASPIGVSAFRETSNDYGDLLFSSTLAIDEARPPSLAVTVFPFIVSGGGYSTELVLFGQDGQPVSGEMFFHSPSGTPQH